MSSARRMNGVSRAVPIRSFFTSPKQVDRAGQCHEFPKQFVRNGYKVTLLALNLCQKNGVFFCHSVLERIRLRPGEQRVLRVERPVLGLEEHVNEKLTVGIAGNDHVAPAMPRVDAG